MLVDNQVVERQLYAQAVRTGTFRVLDLQLKHFVLFDHKCSLPIDSLPARELRGFTKSGWQGREQASNPKMIQVQWIAWCGGHELSRLLTIARPRDS
jgi:hypothetical protein